MASYIVNVLIMIGTLASAVAAVIAAFAAIKSAKSWKAQSGYETRRDAVNAWVSGAAIFRGRLKFVYLDNLTWPQNKDEIEYISEHFWNWVALWPYAHAVLSGDEKSTAEGLWAEVYETYSAVMNGEGRVERLCQSVEAVYNSGVLEGIVGSNTALNRTLLPRTG